MIQSLFPVKKTAINNFQNINALIICSLTTYLYLTNSIDHCDLILFPYLAFDLFLAQKEAIIHHIFTMSITACKKIYNFSNEDANALSTPFLKTEISTIFLMLKIIYDENASETIKKNRFAKILYGINDALFILSFAKFRIFDMFFYVISNPEFYNMTSKYMCLTENYCMLNQLHVYGGVCGLYVMNIYWFSIMLKKIYKQMVISTFPQINTDKFAEGVLSWTMFAAILPYVCNLSKAASLKSDFIRAASLKSHYLYDIVGITVLSFASNCYHSRKHNILQKHEEVLITNNVIVNGLNDNEKDASAEFFFDAGAIHLKSFLSLIAMGSDRGKISSNIHFVFFVGSYIYSLQPNQIVSSYNKHTSVLNACVIIPALYDLTHIIFLANSYEAQMPIAMSIAAIGIILIVKPLYNLNHLAVHFLVILQTWYIATAIMNIN